MGCGMIELLSKWPERGPLYQRETMVSVATRWAKQYGMTLADLTGPKRSQPYVVPRRLAIAEMRAAGRSLAQIGRFFNRDHSSMRYAVRRAAGLSPWQANRSDALAQQEAT
jgi:chromosomal replication initiation ATPase DnaA